MSTISTSILFLFVDYTVVHTYGISTVFVFVLLSPERALGSIVVAYCLIWKDVFFTLIIVFVVCVFE